MASSDSDSDDTLDWLGAGFGRASYPIGNLHSAGLLPRSCIGDDFTLKGSKVTRAASLQASGAGGSPGDLAEGWCGALRDLRLDISAVCESRISTGWKHRLVENLFAEFGFAAISHNRPADVSSDDPHTNSSGVIIGIPTSTPGGMTEIDKDLYGRAIAACVPVVSSASVRFVGVYGPKRNAP